MVVCTYVMMEKHTVLQLLGMCCFQCYLTIFSIFSKYCNNISTSSFEFSVHTLKKYVKFGFLMYYFPFSGLFDELIRKCLFTCALSVFLTKIVLYGLIMFKIHQIPQNKPYRLLKIGLILTAAYYIFLHFLKKSALFYTINWGPEKEKKKEEI